MPTTSRQTHQRMVSDEPVVIYTDDGGSGMLEACQARFTSPDYEVLCDARHTVWVKRTDGTRSFGLPPWALRRHSLEEVLDGLEKKLTLPLGAR